MIFIAFLVGVVVGALAYRWWSALDFDEFEPDGR